MIASRLIGGTLALCGLYAAVAVATTVEFTALAAAEGVVFSIVILWAHSETRISRWAVLPPLGAVLNFGIVWGWPFVLALPVAILRPLGWPVPLEAAIAFGFYSALGALVYAWIVDAVLAPAYFSARTYMLAVGLCALAGLPLDPGSAALIAIHKALWFSLFCIALLVTSGAIKTTVTNGALVRPE